MTKPNYPSAGQGVLAGLEAPDDLRHPMWTKPKGDDEMPEHIRALRKEIAVRLIPFDGLRRSSIESFCAHVHMLSTLETAHRDPLWLIGQIVVSRHGSTEALNPLVDRGQRARADQVALQGLGDHFIEAVVRHAGT